MTGLIPDGADGLPRRAGAHRALRRRRGPRRQVDPLRVLQARRGAACLCRRDGVLSVQARRHMI